MTKKLSKRMSLSSFENGYWYLIDLKEFAKKIEIQNYSKLRKDQLEKEISYYLKNGKIRRRKVSAIKQSKLTKDSDKKLSLKTQIKNFTNDKVTKEFIEAQALRKEPNLPKKSGCKYWLNRWREENLSKGNKITYGDLVNEYIRLRKTKGNFPQIPSTKFNNFVQDYLANNEGTRAQAMKEWEILKKLDVPKNFKSWKKNKDL